MPGAAAKSPQPSRVSAKMRIPCLSKALVYSVAAERAADDSFSIACLAFDGKRLLTGDLSTRSWIHMHNFPLLDMDYPSFTLGIGTRHSPTTTTRHTPGVFHCPRFLGIFHFVFWGDPTVREWALNPDKHSGSADQSVDFRPFLGLSVRRQLVEAGNPFV